MPKRIDETGNRYGSWTVLRYDNNFTKTGGAAWVCQCDCGTVKSIRGTELRQGRSKSCGCKVRDNLTGQQYGKLIVVGEDPNNSAKCTCQCECGKLVSVFKSHLKRGNSKSCGSKECKIPPSLRKDLTDQKFGKLQAIKRVYPKDKKGVYWLCKCDCGQEKEVLSQHLISHKIQSCGCDTSSRGEKKIKDLLLKENISFISEKTFSDCIYPDTQYHPRFDFFVNNSYIIEFDGRQHFEINTWNKTSKDLTIAQTKDMFKNQYCWTHNIPIIRIPYYHLEQLTIQDLLLETSSFIVKEIK